MVTQFYRDLLGREPDSPGLMFWTAVLDQHQTSAYEVALGLVNSPEYRMQEVENVYHTFLHRQADPTGVTAWTQFLERRHTLEQLQVQIVTSPEYFQDRANGNTDLLLATLITDA